MLELIWISLVVEEVLDHGHVFREYRGVKRVRAMIVSRVDLRAELDKNLRNFQL